ncbi:MAG: nucleotidyltransferase domain-containing protein [bacterium]
MKTLEKTALIQNEREAIEATVGKLKREFPVDKVVLFGSKARGDFDEHSDIDLLIITSSPLHWKDEKAIVEVLCLEYDVIFSPLFVSNSELEGGLFGQSPIYQEILRDGAIAG